MKNLVPLSDEIKHIIFVLNQAGFEAYAVGGCVRDSILANFRNTEALFSDIDLTTNATPTQMKAVFKDFRIVETGIKHGTITLILQSGVSVEITTFRSESGYSDNRHPDSVQFQSSLADDLSRRDFTINALCFHPDGTLIDLFGGVDDLKNSILRAIGDPAKRFEEDSLRILRAMRFASTYGFEIHPDTKAAIFEKKQLLKNVSAERIYSELKKMLCGKYIKPVLLEYFEIFSFIIPELNFMKGFCQHNFHHKYDVWGHTAEVVANAPQTVVLRFAALFHDCGKVDTFSLDENGVGHFYGHAEVSAHKAKDALKRLKAERKTIDSVFTLVKFHDSPIEESPKAIRRRLNKFGKDMLFDLISLQLADTMGLADEFFERRKHFETLFSILEAVLEKESCFSLSSLNVNGRDLIDIGLSGREIGSALNFLLNAVIDGKVLNNREDLLDFLKTHETN